MATEYFKPMLDVGSPRVLNCNVLTKRIKTKEPTAANFFRNAPFNRLVLIKDTVNDGSGSKLRSSIGTKLYIPFNENNIYEGGRTIFFHDKHLQQALEEHFGAGALKKEALDEDMRILAVLDRLPSLDPFLLKDVFLNEKIDMHPGYFEVGEEVWKEIEEFILLRFEPLVKAAFPDAMSSDEKARQLVQKIWEARDPVALDPLIQAFRLPKGEALEIFSSWKGINFYAFQYQKMKPLLTELVLWLRDLQLPIAAVSATERTETKASLELIRTQIKAEWQNAEKILRDYQDAYDKMFKHKTSSTEFLAFLNSSARLYWELGNSLGKLGHASYCWDVMSKRFPQRKMPWEQLREIIMLLAKIFKPTPKTTTAVSW